MGRKGNTQAEAKQMDSPAQEPWSFTTDLDEFAKELGIGRRKGLGRSGTNVQFVEMRFKDRNLELDYRFSSGGGHLVGTMVIAYNRDDPLGVAAEMLFTMAEEAFHNIRRSRD